MAKTNSSFKLSKSVKRTLALFGGTKELRNNWKRAMIDAECTAEYNKRTSSRRKEKEID